MLLTKTFRAICLTKTNLPKLLKPGSSNSIRNNALEEFRRGHRYQAPHDLSLRERLGLLAAPAVFTAFISAATYSIAKHFKPQIGEFDENRGRQQVKYVAYGLIAANVAGFLFSRFGRNPRTIWFLENYMEFYLYHNTIYRRTLSMLPSLFSHEMPAHLVANLIFLPITASLISDPFEYLHVYLSGGLAATLGVYIYSAIFPRFAGYSYGASGAIMAVLGYGLSKKPNESISIPFLDRYVSGNIVFKHCLWLFVIYNTAACFRSPSSLGHLSHLVGLGYGCLHAGKPINDK